MPIYTHSGSFSNLSNCMTELFRTSIMSSLGLPCWYCGMPNFHLLCASCAIAEKCLLPRDSIQTNYTLHWFSLTSLTLLMLRCCRSPLDYDVPRRVILPTASSQSGVHCSGWKFGLL